MKQYSQAEIDKMIGKINKGTLKRQQKYGVFRRLYLKPKTESP